MGALWTRNDATDGRGRGVQGRGRYRFNGTQTGNAYADMLLGLTRDVTDFVSTRGDLSGHSNDIAGFVQDDWKASRDLTLFLGLRYEIVGNWHEKGDVLGNFRPDDGGFHIVPNAQVATLLPPGVQDLGRTKTAEQAGVPETLIFTDKNNFSPRVGFAYRLGGTDKTVLRGGFGLFHPTVAVQGVRDLFASNMFRFSSVRRGSPLQHGFTGGTAVVSSDDFGNQGIDPHLQSPDIYQYNVTLERAISDAFGVRVSYIGSTMRKLIVDRDMNTLPASTDFFDGDLSNPDSKARLPLPLYGYYADNVINAGRGQFHSLQLELTRRFRGGLAFDVAVHPGPLRQQRPRRGGQQPGRRAVRPLRHREGPRARPQRGQAPGGGQRDVGGAGGPGPLPRHEHVGLGQRALRRLDGLVALPGPHREQPDPVLLELLHDEPLEHRQAPRRARQLLLLRVAARPGGRSR
jgi:hypothetical protein